MAGTPTKGSPYNDAANLALDALFQQKVLIAMITAALAVQAEINTTPNHLNRSNYAKLVLNSPQSYLTQFCNACVTNAAITANSLDSDLQFEVNAIWSSMAGVI